MEWGNVSEGLRRLQCADVTAERADDPRLQAAIVSDSAIAYARQGATRETHGCVARATDLVMQGSGNDWYAMSDVHSAGATARGELGGNIDDAVAALYASLPENPVRKRSHALRLVSLARITQNPKQHAT